MGGEELEVEGQGLAQTLKDLFAGAAGGVAQVLLGESSQCWIAGQVNLDNMCLDI